MTAQRCEKYDLVALDLGVIEIGEVGSHNGLQSFIGDTSAAVIGEIEMSAYENEWLAADAVNVASAALLLPGRETP